MKDGAQVTRQTRPRIGALTHVGKARVEQGLSVIAADEIGHCTFCAAPSPPQAPRAVLSTLR